MLAMLVMVVMVVVVVVVVVVAGTMATGDGGMAISLDRLFGSQWNKMERAMMRLLMG